MHFVFSEFIYIFVLCHAIYEGSFCCVQEKLQEWLLRVKRLLQEEVNKTGGTFDFGSCMLYSYSYISLNDSLLIVYWLVLFLLSLFSPHSPLDYFINTRNPILIVVWFCHRTDLESNIFFMQFRIPNSLFQKLYLTVCGRERVYVWKKKKIVWARDRDRGESLKRRVHVVEEYDIHCWLTA